MGKTLRFRISQVIKSSLQSCRSKQPPTLSPHPQPPPPPSSSFTQHVTSAFISLGCGCAKNSNHRIKPQEFMWQKHEEEWHIIPKQLSTNYDDSDHSSSPRHKIYNSSVSNDDTTDYDCILPPTPPKKANKKRRTKKKKTTTNNNKKQYRISTSSADSGLTNIFSSEERELIREETETLVSSSRSFSTDSSSNDFNTQLETIRETSSSTPRNKRTSSKKKKKKMITKKSKCRVSVSTTSSGSESPARLSVLKKLWRVEGGKVRGSRAVVKKSEDPYGDFKRSMTEMICEKDMYEETDLEQLLHCFLSLNSPQHHPTIIHAFSEIWNSLFSPTTSN